MAMIREAFDWLKPSPLWDGGLAGARAPDFFQPQLLEFDDDNFVDAFRQAAAARDPSALKSAVRTGSFNQPVKLFQPAHGRFYLVTAALTCRFPGFPERVVQLADGETAFFVIRKFVAGLGEHAWDGKNKVWQPLNGQPRQVPEAEERLPLFHAAGSDSRTIFVGYVPVASQEVYSVPVQTLNAAATTPAELARFPIDLRIEELQGRFTTPLENPLFPPKPDNVVEVAQAADQLARGQGQQSEQALTLSVYLLLDLWEYLDKHLPDVAAALRDNLAASFTGDQAAGEAELMAFLGSQVLPGGLALDAALHAVAQHQDALNAVGGADPIQLGFDEAHYSLARPSPISNPKQYVIDTTGLENAVHNALPADTCVVLLPRQSPVPGDTFAIRCVYERPQCSPPQQVVSQPSAAFQLATFFDGDAPARPIRIVLPTDVSIAGMRKFQKGVTFVISDSLQQKINMITGREHSLLADNPPQLGSSGSGGLSFMCSFSIQIVFIVAFMLLLVFVIILNFAFWWIAFFRICIPIPKKLLSG